MEGAQKRLLEMAQDHPLTRPTALVTVVFAVYCCFLGAWDAFTKLCLCALCVTIARLLQSEYLRRELRRHKQPVSDGHSARGRLYSAAIGLLLTVLLQVLLSPKTPWLVAEHWYLLLVAPLLAVALQLSGTPRAELSEALCETQTNYAQGAAWGFYIGYLLKIFSEDGGSSFENRMSDYLTSNEIDEEGHRLTYKRRMFVLVPMKRAALLSDKDLKDNDRSVIKEQKLKPVTSGGRTYGETQVYTIQQDNQKRRLAMEEATPIRTAAMAVDDAEVEDFDDDDFEEFARRFLMALQAILQSKQSVCDQIELVPVTDPHQIGRTVVDRLQKLDQMEKNMEGQEELAAELAADGSVAARRPEQDADLVFNRNVPELAAGGLPNPL